MNKTKKIVKRATASATYLEKIRFGNIYHDISIFDTKSNKIG
jgi:hypothetical protein